VGRKQALLWFPPSGGRSKPYTEIGIRRVYCYRCEKPARQQWSICSMGNRYFPVCTECDILLNAFVLGWMCVPDRVKIMERYKKKIRKGDI
jgi:hypothetical protein